VRFCAWFGLLLLLAGSGGCCTPFGSASRPNVVVLRGIIGYWPFIEPFEKGLCAEGICPTTALAEGYPQVANEIEEGRRSGRWQGPLVIVGYSSGANCALKLCRDLGGRGITVDKLVLLEASYRDLVPENVRQCVNIYKSQPATDWIPIFRGIPLCAESDGTDLENRDIHYEPYAHGFLNHHLTICANPVVQRMMIDEVLETIDSEAGRQGSTPGTPHEGSPRAGCPPCPPACVPACSPR
jgi:hypothetical protein